MNTYKVKNIKDAAASKLQGSSINNVQAPYQTLRQAVTTMWTRIAPPETLRTATITADSDGIATAPSDLKSAKIVSIYDSTGYYADHTLTPRSSQRVNGGRNTLSVEYDSTASGYVITLDRYARAGDYTVEYYTDHVFELLDGTLSNVPESDNDLILLEEDTLLILMWEYVWLLAGELQGADAEAIQNDAEVALGINGQRPGLYAKYKRHNPSQAKTRSKQYYRRSVTSRYRRH